MKEHIRNDIALDLALRCCTCPFLNEGNSSLDEQALLPEVDFREACLAIRVPVVSLSMGVLSIMLYAPSYQRQNYSES